MKPHLIFHTTPAEKKFKKLFAGFIQIKNIFNEWSEQIKGLEESRRVLFYASFLDDDGVYKDICVLNDGIAIGRVDSGGANRVRIFLSI
ncbi:hypothetical protein [Thermococcus barophilus]|uniref:hypothetical protein n=1 Tax=Thermococcus barophilus TaxID=55802 RepID=UPI00070484F3|nr:hypothetical protein [Thermococcus barophilus]